MLRVVRFINTINEKAKGVAYLLPALVIVMLVGVIARYAFNNPTPWTDETSAFINVAIVMGGGGYALLHGLHVNVDVVQKRFRPTIGRIVAFCGYIVFILLFAVIFFLEAVKVSIFSWTINEHSNSIWGPPLYPARTFLAIGGALLLMQVVAALISILTSPANKEGKE